MRADSFENDRDGRLGREDIENYRGGRLEFSVFLKLNLDNQRR